jgi:hypothetical protein
LKNHILLLLLLLAACKNNPTTPEEILTQNGLETTQIGVLPVEVPEDAINCFDSLGITRSGITHRLVDRTLFIYVPASNADYVNVWTPGVNDALLGRGPVNDEFHVTLRTGLT